MTKEAQNPNDEFQVMDLSQAKDVDWQKASVLRISCFGFLSSFGIRHSSFDNSSMVPMHGENERRLSMKSTAAANPESTFRKTSLTVEGGGDVSSVRKV